MSEFKSCFEYLSVDDVKLFTVVMLPFDGGKFPTVIYRSPYVDWAEDKDESEITEIYEREHKIWLEHGYAVVFQHCRGRGKSEGDCIPYINERGDGLFLQDWIRKQSFYNGELYLNGGSYLTSVHYVTSPFADDIKGAIFGIQDSERYNVCYRNGFLKIGLHVSWYVEMYKAKSHMKKNYTPRTCDMLPMSDFTKTVFGEPSANFDEMLKSPKKSDKYWNTLYGGSDARGATDNAKFPILFTTGFYDIYTGGIFDMWNAMSEETRSRSALVVSPYDHGDFCDRSDSIVFENGRRLDAFGHDYEVRWLDSIRFPDKEAPFEKGKITYYRLFENKWTCDTFDKSDKMLEIKLGDREVSYVYNPYDAPSFKGGLSRAFGGALYQDKPGSRHDIVSLYTDRFEKDVFVKGKMTAKLAVKSSCEDTCFFVRVSIEKEGGDYPLRDDITSICYACGDYTPENEVTLDLEFDEHAFLVKSGERLRIDIASADREHYVRHTNNKGLFSEQTTAKIAKNTVFLQRSYLCLPIED